MSNIDTALTLRLEASLAKFEKQMARATRAGETTANGLQRQFDKSNKAMAKSAERSASVIGAEMDRLRTKFDPLFAASKRYEGELEELNRAHKLGALNAKQYDAALTKLNGRYAAMNPQVTGLKRGLAGLSRSTKGSAGGIQNVAFQVGDFATQVGAGTSASVALGQQLPQLLGGFGALGAVLGAVVAIGVPLAAALLKSGDSADAMEKQIEELEQAVNDYRSAVEAANIPTAELAEKYGTATQAARVFLSALEDIANLDQLSALETTLTTLSDTFGELTAETNELGRGGGGAVNEVRRSLEQISAQLGLSKDDAELFAKELRGLKDAATPEEAVKATKELIDLFDQLVGPASELTGEAKQFRENLASAGIQAAEIVGISQSVANGIASASSEAAGLAANLGGAVAQMRALANARINDARVASEQARIRSNTVGQPVERAGQLAVSDFRNSLDDGGYSLIANGRAEQLADSEGAVQRAAAEAARLSQQASEAETAYASLQREIAKPARAKKATRKKATKEEFDPFKIGDDALVSAERNIQMLGKTASQVVELQAKYAMLDEAKRRNIDLDKVSAQTGLTVGQTIEQNAAKIAQLTDEYSRANAQAEYFDDINGQIKNGIIDAIVEGENFADVLKDVAKSFAKVALEAALFGSGPMAGLFGGQSGGAIGGGSLFGGIVSGIGSLFGFSSGGYTGNGGRNQPAGVVHGQEYVVNAQNTARFRPQLEAMNRGQMPNMGGGSSNVQVTVGISADNNGNLMPFVESVAQSKATNAAGKVAQAVPAISDQRGQESQMRRIGPAKRRM